MKTTTAIKKIQKAGATVNADTDNGYLWARFGDYVLEIYSQIDWRTNTFMETCSISATNMKMKEADSNPMNGSCYTSYYSNVTQALKSLVSKK